jgi:hypothetical protein
LKPDWWEKNERYRERFELPEYDPPKFNDDIYTYKVINSLEEEHGCTIQFLGVNTKYPDDIDIRIDSKTAFSVGRRRTSGGNTIYKITSEEFRERVNAYCTDQTS